MSFDQINLERSNARNTKTRPYHREFQAQEIPNFPGTVQCFGTSRIRRNNHRQIKKTPSERDHLEVMIELFTSIPNDHRNYKNSLAESDQELLNGITARY